MGIILYYVCLIIVSTHGKLLCWNFHALFVYADNADAAVFKHIYVDFIRIFDRLKFVIFVETVQAIFLTLGGHFVRISSCREEG